MQWIIDFLMLFFPSNCLVCGKRLHSPRAILCFECEMKMPKTGFGDRGDNPVSKIFWGRVPVRVGTSLFRFEKGSAYQTLLHDLKYRGNRRAGLYLGRMLGQELKHTSFSDCDLMVPVPLHHKRMKKRGYNQSEIIARGASEITGIPVAAHLIERKGHSQSQTSMNRQERFENMATAFTLCDGSLDLNDKKILIIDDVVTTGATLEACSQVLFSHFECLVYIATVSCA
ncbi:MAG: ComF family protein [Bacteroidales bacterium]|nr:ComF family protein [Bacteroidales bacterium]